MEHVIEQGQDIFKKIVPVLVFLGVIASIAVIAYGAESVAPGVHDAFHDLRHSIGMACH